MKVLQPFFRLLPSLALLTLSLVILIFDLGSIPWVSTLQDILIGATLWQFCTAISGLLKAVIQDD